LKTIKVTIILLEKVTFREKVTMEEVAFREKEDSKTAFKFDQK